MNFTDEAASPFPPNSNSFEFEECEWTTAESDPVKPPTARFKFRARTPQMSTAMRDGVLSHRRGALRPYSTVFLSDFSKL